MYLKAIYTNCANLSNAQLLTNQMLISVKSASDWSIVVPRCCKQFKHMKLLANCFVFLGERDRVEHHSGLLYRFAFFLAKYEAICFAD